MDQIVELLPFPLSVQPPDGLLGDGPEEDLGQDEAARCEVKVAPVANQESEDPGLENGEFRRGVVDSQVIERHGNYSDNTIAVC